MKTMTTTEVCQHLETTRTQLSRWAASGALVPIARGEYEEVAVKAFKKPTSGQPKGNKQKTNVRSIMQI